MNINNKITFILEVFIALEGSKSRSYNQYDKTVAKIFIGWWSSENRFLKGKENLWKITLLIGNIIIFAMIWT